MRFWKHFLNVELNGCCSIFSGIDLISGVSCKSPHEWVDKTKQEWDFNSKGRGETFHVSIYVVGIAFVILVDYWVI